MAFLAQVRLSDVPALTDDGGLLSFHYCLLCTYAGEMSFGRDDLNRGYSVALIDVCREVGPDDHGIVAPGCLPAMTATLSAAEEVLGLEDAWALDLELPAGLFDGDEDDFDEHIGCGLSHVPRSKLGGWPSWQQTPQWLTCAEGRRMTFVAQIDYALGEDSPWANGGYAYLFVCGRECAHREADLVIQTT